METSGTYLDQALKTGEQELAALLEGDVDAAAELSDKRTWLISQAWTARTDLDNSVYRTKLLEVQKMQERLTEEARQLRESIRAGLVQSRKQGQCLNAYRTAVAHSM